MTKRAAKAAFGTEEWAGQNVNILNGCEHDCAYCYAKERAVSLKRRTPKNWKTPVVNEKKVNKGWQKRKHTLMFPSTHDVHPHHLDDYLTVLQKLLRAGNKVLDRFQAASAVHRTAL